MRDSSSVFRRLLLRENASPGVRVLRYAIAGSVSTVLYFVLVVVLVELAGLDPVVSAVAVFVLLSILVYVVNRSWVFESTRSHRSAFPRFVLVSVVGILLNATIMHATVHILHWWYVVGLGIATLVVPPTNFLLNRYWAFRQAPAQRSH